jgi:aerobic C4-dicarboxylate transport protein
MKLWIKYILATVIGILIGTYIFPEGNGPYENLRFTMQIILNIGRYAMLPMVFFSLAYGVYRLRLDRRILVILGKTAVIIITSSILLIAVGTLAVILLDPERIPIIIETETVHRLPTFREMILAIFPTNLFRLFIESGDFMFPLVLFSLFLGLNFTFDKVLTRPTVQLFDSLSRIFYHISKFVNEILGLGLIILATGFVVHLRQTEELELYSQLILLLGLLAAFIIFGLYPLLLYFFVGRQNPYRHLYAILAPSIAAFLSANSYFALVPLTAHVKENLGVPRKIGATALPLFTIFSKAGTAMVTSITFVVILKSYSSLGIGFSEITWIMSLSFSLSLLTSAVPGFGVAAALSALCVLYGRGIENGFLIIYPILPVLGSFAVFLDVVTSALGTVVITHSEEEQKAIYLKDYI